MAGIRLRRLICYNPEGFSFYCGEHALKNVFRGVSGFGNGCTRRISNSSDSEVSQINNDLNTLEKDIGYSFKDKSLLLEALTHRSAQLTSSTNLQKKNQERLEFLGDAVLYFATAIRVYTALEDANEHSLSSARKSMIGDKVLEEVANQLQLQNYVISKESWSVRRRASIDAVEAIIGAIYCDSGIRNAQKFVKKFFWATKSLQDLALKTDPVTKYSELYQKVFREGPSRPTFVMTGPENAPIFTATVDISRFGFAPKAVGKGGTKSEARRMACEEALRLLEDEGTIRK